MHVPSAQPKVRRPKKNGNYGHNLLALNVAELTDDITKILSELKEFLTAHLRYSDDEASVYLLGLEEGTVTSGSVSRRIQKMRITTAKDILDRLAGQGLFQQTPRAGESPSAGRGHVTHYRVVPPGLAFTKFFQGYSRFKGNTEKMGEHLEVKSESDLHGSEIWLTRQQRVATAQGAKIIQGAKKSLKIYGHDCSWLSDPELRDAITKAAGRNVRVEILATELSASLNKTIREAGVTPKTTEFLGMPFCIVDDSRLLMPHVSGEFERDFGLLSTTNHYTVRNFVRTFESIRGQKGGRC